MASSGSQFLAGRRGSDALARINPLKQIPTLVTPDGQVLTESAAILIHLGLEFPASALLAGNRAQILRGLVYRRQLLLGHRHHRLPAALAGQRR
jgi:glutathione S-transferase